MHGRPFEYLKMELLPKESQKDANDEDVLTNEMCKEKKLKGISTLKNKTLKMVSTITGAQISSRRRLFYDIQSNCDIKIWWVLYDGKEVKCIKVFNPAILLDKVAECHKNIKNAQRLEIEDPEGILARFPKHIDASNLEKLVVTWTRLKKLPKCCYHSKLKYLDMQRNAIRSLEGINKATNLKVFNASNNAISYLPHTFSKLEHLVDLDLSHNLLQELPNFLSAFRLLESFDCSNNSIKQLPTNIGNLVSLTTLNVSSNQISELPSSIGALCHLLDFTAFSNNLSQLPISFVNLKKLKSLNLRKNRFSDALPEMKELVSLQQLNLKDNFLVDFACVMPALKFLNLDNNKIEKLSSRLFECFSLETLSLQCNNIKYLPSSLHKLTNLKLFCLSHNPLTELPLTISSLQSLRQLHLSHTPIETLPTSVRLMRNLSRLEIDECARIDPYLKLEWKCRGVQGVKTYLQEKHQENMPKKDSGFTNSCLYENFEVLNYSEKNGELAETGRHVKSRRQHSQEGNGKYIKLLGSTNTDDTLGRGQAPNGTALNNQSLLAQKYITLYPTTGSSAYSNKNDDEEDEVGDSYR